MDNDRIKHLIANPNNDDAYILYWMQAEQRPDHNHALAYAVHLANERQLPVVCLFTVDLSYPDANERHVSFMFEGMKETFDALKRKGITPVLRQGHIEDAIDPFLNDTKTIISDVGHLRWQRLRRKALYFRLIGETNINLYAVSGHVLVPVDIASDKEEYGAYTIRPKINRMFKRFLDEDTLPALKNTSSIDLTSDIDIQKYHEFLKQTSFSDNIKKVTAFTGGPKAAKQRLDDFLKNKLDYYDEANDPGKNLNSKLSPYLHFGQISPLAIIRAVRNSSANQDAKDAFLEQLVIRRELAHNYVWFNKQYDDFNHMTVNWAYKTMDRHVGDKRPYLYTADDYINQKTHDPYFNAAMKEMIATGYMKNYMRMYWGKKIIEWSEDFKTAYNTILTLNNTYFLDGRDANSYAGVAWCFGKHDRAWKERDVFGKLRYMNENGLTRKFDMDAYLNRVDQYEKDKEEKS